MNNYEFLSKEFKEMRAIMDDMMAMFGAQMGFTEMDPELIGIYNKCVVLFNTLEEDSLEWARQQDLYNEEVMSQLRLAKDRDQLMIGMIKDLSDNVRKKS